MRMCGWTAIAKFCHCRSCFRIMKRKGKPDICASIRCPYTDEQFNRECKACKSYVPQWYWKMMLSKTKVMIEVRNWFCMHIRSKIGALRKPVPLVWVPSYEPDKVEPICPYCGEMPYSITQCVWCGQRFKGELKKWKI